MFIPEIEGSGKLAKRIIYYTNNRNNSWTRHRWLLWLILIIPFILVILFMFLRRARSRRPIVNSTQEQFYPQTGPPQGPPQGPPPTAQTGGYYYGDQSQQGGGQAYVPPQFPQSYNAEADPGYGGFHQGSGSARPDGPPPPDYARPEGPPPAHTKF
ncbi:uncharacterized protein RJT20DRAFT_56884 [Scheffersomyces xylosifermentans]|uniref:uncharacterized protein n=1 Tax=Scheffersomyces xylosifermentans TaxID=1304137 RepID=UPI00315DD4B2